jgi:hypothetical protein
MLLFAGGSTVRFFLAFFIILAANSPQGVGMGLLLCLWKIADLVYDLKPKKANKPDTANNTLEIERRSAADER